MSSGMNSDIKICIKTCPKYTKINKIPKVFYGYTPFIPWNTTNTELVCAGIVFFKNTNGNKQKQIYISNLTAQPHL